jgi:hypothetical protein
MGYVELPTSSHPILYQGSVLIFSIRIGRECWCGGVLDPTSQSVDQSECNMPCSGDAESTCGAGVRLSLYKLTATTPDPTNPVELPAGDYQSLGW